MILLKKMINLNNRIKIAVLGSAKVGKTGEWRRVDKLIEQRLRTFDFFNALRTYVMWNYLFVDLIINLLPPINNYYSLSSRQSPSEC